jgi:hypothetical protein
MLCLPCSHRPNYPVSVEAIAMNFDGEVPEAVGIQLREAAPPDLDSRFGGSAKPDPTLLDVLFDRHGISLAEEIRTPISRHDHAGL